MRVADYVANACAEYGVKVAFSVVGGGAMHLNDAFGHHKDIEVIYNHHEQACAIGAEGYARVNNALAAVVVTTGPGGINAMNGVVGAYVDSVPMIVISGQVRRDSFSVTTGLPLRAMGDQEFNVVPAAKTMTKYAECVMDPSDIRYVVEKALYLSTHGRKGPTWIDIPGDVQSAQVNPEKLRGYDPKEDEVELGVSKKQLEEVLRRINKAKRPVIYAGSAIRLSGSYDAYKRLIEKLGCPVVTAWNSTDVIENDHPLYAGRAGNFGDRFGNFAVQNSDFILSLGCRLSIRQTGFNYASWAREAFVIDVDIDEAEMKKPTIHVELPIHDDLADFIPKLLSYLSDKEIKSHDAWVRKCKSWMRRYPIVSKAQRSQKELVNAYAAVELLSSHVKEGTLVVSGNGTACVVGGQVFITKKGTRFIENSGMASMGYDLPAAIGASIASNRGQVLCLTGEGSIQMNLQELQTIVGQKLPIKIVIFNNGGYHSIRQSQSNFFRGRKLCGIGPESCDLTFPDMGKLAKAYGIPYYAIHSNAQFKRFLNSKYDSLQGYAMIELFCDTKQYFEPKAGSMKLEDGSMVSAPLEDLKPYLDREELKKDMIIPLYGEKK
jgi:acetolactate synthase-1/2/3 large subunit